MHVHARCSRQGDPHAAGHWLPMVLAIALLLASSVAQVEAQPDDRAGNGDAVTMLRGGAARTGVHPGPGPLSTPEPVWVVHLGDLIVSSPVVAGDLVYVGSVSPSIAAGGALHALDRQTGEEVWRAALDRGDGILSTPAVVDGVVYVATHDGVVLAVDAATGAQGWRVLLDTEVFYSSLAVEDGRLHVGDTGGRLFALDIEDGRRVWDVRIGDGNAWSMGTPAVAGGQVYAVASSARVDEPSELVALDAETGEARWTFVAEDAGEVRGIPAVTDGRVYVPTTLGAVYALSARDGSVAWRFDSAREISATSPTVVNDEVIIGTDDGWLHGIDAETGEETRSLPEMTEGGYLVTPTVADDVVYAVDTSGMLHAIDLETEEVVWTAETGSIGSSPAIIGGVIYIGNEFGLLLALS